MKGLRYLMAVPAFCAMLVAGFAFMSCSGTGLAPTQGQSGEDGGYGDTLRIVDLGLNVYWADRNVDADSPYAAGIYMGSEGLEQATSLWNLIEYVKSSTGRNYWTLPSWEDVQELYDHCTFEEMYADDGMTKVMRVTGPNGNCIYLPLAGKSRLKEYSDVNSVGYYIYQYSPGNLTGKWRIFNGNKSSYQYICSSPIRPIAYKDEKVSWEDYFGKVPTEEEAVDLGLSVKWAPWNIGSDRPEIYGGFYGWGDPTGKLHSENPDDYPIKDEPGTISIKDLAMAKWGINWHTPTKEQMEELINGCTWEWTQMTGTRGYRVTGPNGNSIFLPAGGHRQGESRKFPESEGYYWTSTREPSKYGVTMDYSSLFFTRESISIHDISDQWMGKSIRPVYIPR